LNELEAKIRALDEYKSKIGQLRTENGDLLSKLQSKEQDAMDVIKYLRSENDSLQEKLRIYAEDSEKAKEMTEKIVMKANEDRDFAIAEMETRFKHKEEGRESEMRKLQEELASLKSFKEQRDQYESTIARLREELAQEQEAHRQAMISVERKLIEEKNRLQKEAHAQLMEIKRNTDEEVVNRLDVSTKRILQQNRRLAEDLKLHVQETAELQKLKSKLEEDNKQLRRDLELNEQQIGEYAKDRHRLSREVKDLQGKVKNLEKSLSQVAKDFEREKERLVSKSKQDLQDTEVENSGLRKLLKIKEKEHNKIKRLAQDIISQRSEVEQFFLEALEEVRDQIAREKLKSSSSAGPSNTFITEESSTHFQGREQGRLPQIRGGAGAGGAGGGGAGSKNFSYVPNQKVDIKDLTWEDKERVLRILFAKINQSQMPSNSHSQPDHPRPEQELDMLDGRLREELEEETRISSSASSEAPRRMSMRGMASLRQPDFA